MSKITKHTSKKYSQLYMVYANLSGFSKKIYKLTCPDGEDMWVDDTEDECFMVSDNKQIGWNIDEGRVEFITPVLEDALKVSTAISVYRDMLKKRL